MIPYGRQQIDDEDIQAVVSVLKSDFLTQGPAVPAFEIAISKYCSVDHAVAASSATAALHIACLALGVGRGDLVWTSPISFVASSNCALYCGAQVDFVDIDPETYNMSTEALAQKLEEAEAVGRLPKVVIPVHMCGQSCEMAAIQRLSKRYGFRIIEDASHGVGGSYQGTPIGCCDFSDIVIFSFHPVKIITTGEGGVAVTRDAELATRMRLFRSHGITRDNALMTKEPDGTWYYQQIELGYNYRLTDIQAALGVSQMQKVDSFVRKRQYLADRYFRLLSSLPVSLPKIIPAAQSSWHLFVVRLRLDQIRRSQKEVFDFLVGRGIGVNLHYVPIYTQPYYRKLGFVDGYCVEAEKYYSEAISIPLFAGMAEEQQDEVVRSLTEALEA